MSRFEIFYSADSCGVDRPAAHMRRARRAIDRTGCTPGRWWAGGGSRCAPMSEYECDANKLGTWCWNGSYRPKRTRPWYALMKYCNTAGKNAMPGLDARKRNGPWQPIKKHVIHLFVHSTRCQHARAILPSVVDK